MNSLFRYSLMLGLCLNLARASVPLGCRYEVRWPVPGTHMLEVRMSLIPADSLTEFVMPSWRPGRYILQDFAAAVSGVRAQDSRGRSLPLRKIAPNRWLVVHSSQTEISLSYRVFADNRDAGSSRLSWEEVYINPVGVCMYVPDRIGEPLEIRFPDLSGEWKAATALQQGPDRRSYVAADYHELADSPIVFAPQARQLEFTLGSTRFYVHFFGTYPDHAQTDSSAVEVLSRICREQGAIFGGFPFPSYHFIYRLQPVNFRHAVEHSQSALFVLPETIAQSPERLRSSIAGISSHEFWHVWNVKRIRPAALWPYDYDRPPFTQLHWFTEGVTDYYAQLTLVRAGIISRQQFFRFLATNLENMDQLFANQHTPPSEGSLDSWLAPSPYLSPEREVSYYAQGIRLGFWIDISLQHRTQGRYSLDELFRQLYADYFLQGRGMPEDAIQSALESLSGQSWETFFADYVHGTRKPDYTEAMGAMGLAWMHHPANLTAPQALGLRSVEETEQGWLIRDVIPGSDAWVQGIAEGEIIAEIDGKDARRSSPATWAPVLKPGKSIQLLLLRNGAWTEQQLTYTAAYQPEKYEIIAADSASAAAAAQLEAWLKSRLP